MIWGMTLEPGKLYTEVMGEEVQLSLAAIDSRKEIGEGSNSFSQIVMKTSKSEYVLCTLVHGVMFQQSLDLKLMPREKVTFSVQGSNVVYLVGYTASYPEDEDGEFNQEEYTEEDSSDWQVYTDDVMLIEDDDDTPTIKKEPMLEGESRIQESDNQDREELNTSQDTTRDVLGQTVFKTEASSPPSATPVSSMSAQGMQMPQESNYGMETEIIGMPPTSSSQDFFYQDGQHETNILAPPPPQPFTTDPLHDLQQQITQEELYPPQETFIKTEERAAPISTPPAPKRTPPPPRRHVRAGVPTPRGRAAPRGRKAGQSRNVGQTRSSPWASHQGMQGASTSGTSVPYDGGDLQQRTWPHDPSFVYPQTSTTDHKQLSLAPPDTSFQHTAFGRRQPLLARAPRRQNSAHKNDSAPRSGFLCKYCSRGFVSMALLRVHERIHTGERPYVCRFCSKSFAQSGNLRCHERTHTGEKRFACPSCGKRFSKKRSLQTHGGVCPQQRQQET